MKNKLTALAFISLLALTACGTKKYQPQDYILSMNYKDDFRILQLTDIHLSDKDDQKTQFKFMDLLYKDANNPDLVVVTGDLFTFASKNTAKSLLKYFDDKGVPWSVCFGNHDEQCYFSVDWLTKTLSEYGSNCLFKDLQDDKVNGNCNFAINLMKDGKVHDQLFVMDSNRYDFNFSQFGYDCFKQDQIDWYERMVNYSKEKYGNVKSSIYLHIAPPEAVIDWEKMDADNCIIGDMQEGLGSPSEDLHFVQKVLDLGVTQSIHANHDHANDAVFKYTKDEKSIYFAYGVHATNRIYNDKEGVKFGGQILRVNKLDTSKLIFENYYVSYDSEEVNVVSSEGKENK